ncbi:MAG: Mom family adenine methylcarbamoylation protein [Planctomycetota bacterium]
MGRAKDIVLRPIDAKTANDLVRRVHYSGKVVNNSQIHIGVFYRGNLEGALQFGPSLDKRKLIGLVEGTLWNEFIELNRLAFTDVLPRNSESRALGVAMRILKKHAPQLKWVISFADGVQCGDGTIYRAAGFVLTGLKEGEELLRLPSGEVCHRIALRTNDKLVAAMGGKMASVPKMAEFLDGAIMPGHMLRYIYFLDRLCRERLTVPEIPYSRIWEVGAGMYRGEKCDEQRADVA